ncbi:MAG: Uma2 family endonuclease [Bacteroidota bacterium]
MPVAPAVTLRMTPEEYFAWEETQVEKHEYVHGEVFPMSGGTRNHALIPANFIAALVPLLRGTGCRVFSSDLRIQIHDDRYTYPDLSVVCGPEQYRTDRQTTLLNPTLIVEVLSDSTAEYDRGEKFEAYRQVASLREYVLVAQDRLHVELFRKEPAGGDGADRWVLYEFAGDDTLTLASVGTEVPMTALYEGVDV